MSTLLKILALLVTLAAVVFVSGLTGILFTLWPTSWPDQPLHVTDSEITLLQRLRAEPKFYADTKRFYPGAVNETNRLEDEALVNDLLSELIVSIRTTPTKSHVLARIKVILSKADDFDSEDQERLASYMEEALRILHIDSSNELINVWSFGFPYGWFLSHAEHPERQ